LHLGVKIFLFADESQLRLFKGVFYGAHHINFLSRSTDSGKFGKVARRSDPSDILIGMADKKFEKLLYYSRLLNDVLDLSATLSYP
jgi:hypothetical protein